MTVDCYPSREPTTHREMRMAVGRQMTRTVLLCALSLAAGIAIGHYFLREQLQVQQGVVGQLHREIRGLTGDIQRIELEHSKSISRFESVIDRMERSHLVALTGEMQNSQHRLTGLQNNVERQLARLTEEHAGLLSELEPYQERHLAVPTDLLLDSLTRLLASRSHDLQQLLDDVRSHISHEQARHAAVQGQWLAGRQPIAPGHESPLNKSLAAFAAVTPVTISTIESDTAAGSTVAASTAAPTEVNRSASNEDVPFELSATQANSSAKTIQVREVQAAATVRRPLVGGVGRRRPYYQLISFGSGRVVSPNVPAPRPLSAVETGGPFDAAQAASESASH
ncbi:MAG: hypothetical protein ACK5Q5_24325 [Planctomycetaceae bacterium]